MTAPRIIDVVAGRVSHVEGAFLVMESGHRVGPFSSHWAACAAMIRKGDPGFRSTGGDRHSDLDLERPLSPPGAP